MILGGVDAKILVLIMPNARVFEVLPLARQLAEDLLQVVHDEVGRLTRGRSLDVVNVR